MLSLNAKIVFVTGASAGIGEAAATAFAAAGAKVLICGRRAERLGRLAKTLEREHKVGVHHFALDVRDQAAVDAAIAELPEDWRAVDILVNNAGLSRGMDKLPGGLVPDWEEMIDTNVKGLLYVTRAVLPGMIARGRGHIINIGSLAGYEVYPGGAVYCASKFGVRALSKGLRFDLNGTPIRVSEIAPGMVETEFSMVRFHGDAERARKVYQGFVPLSPADIAEAIIWCATRPPHVNVSIVEVMPTAQASTTLVHRK
jgi:3-hydroxy acid dehydrogenase/malonic semialdehyde reductase